MMDEANPPLGVSLHTTGPAAHVEALSSEEARINGPCARAEHGHTSGQHRQCDVGPVAVLRRPVNGNCNPQLKKRGQRTRQGYPQAREQKDSSSSSSQIVANNSRLPGLA